MNAQEVTSFFVGSPIFFFAYLSGEYQSLVEVMNAIILKTTEYRIEETKQQRLNIVSPAVFSSFSFSHNFPLLHHATNLTENFFQQLEAL